MTPARAAYVAAYCEQELASGRPTAGSREKLLAKLAEATNALARPHCTRCLAPLTAPKSIARGMGACCAGVA